MRTLLRLLFSPWVIFGAVLVAAVLLAATLALIWFTRPVPVAAVPGTAVLNVIPIPTVTAIPPTPTPMPGPTPTEPPSPPGGTIGVGSAVQIEGTGGDGLRLRARPDLEGKILFLALEGEIFHVQDGPQEVGGNTWWFLVAPYDEEVQGWAVANYLKAVPNP